MVLLHVKQGDESLFLFQAKLDDNVKDVTYVLVGIYNGCLKIKRISSEIEILSEHGAARPAEMHGLLEDQIKDLKLSDDYESKSDPNGGHEENKDPCGRRCGRRPIGEMRDVLSKTTAEAKGIISKEQIKSGVSLTLDHIQDAVSVLLGGIDMVYPTGLPPHDPIRMEIENREDLSGTQEEKRILHPVMTLLWFAGKQLDPVKNLSDYFGKNEKTKVVVKLQKKGSGPPTREQVMSEEGKRKLMLAEFKRREELKKLVEDEDNSYLNSDWADNHHLKKSFHGLSNVSWKPH